LTRKPREIHFSLIGCGNIGSATLRYVNERAGYIETGMGYRLIPEKVYDIDSGSLEFLGELENIRPKIASSVEEVIDDPKTKIIIEATGQDGPARDYIMESFGKGKSVVTPNKLVIAKYMRELFDEARSCGQELGFESSVMAGVPVINNLRGNTDIINKYLAILNGTSNLILTHIPERGYDGALKYARSIGAAEPDASSDTSGRDTANKNKILAALSYGADIDYDTMTSPLFLEGIENITDLDIEFAGEFGYKIKLLGKSRMHKDGRLEIGTFPYLLNSSHILANVDGTNNAIYIDFESKGPELHYGEGAGPMPTRAGVVEDVIQTARKMRGGEVDIPSIWGGIELVDPSELKYPFYLRFSCFDKPGVSGKITTVLGDHEVSIASHVQKKELAEEESVPICMLTYEANVGKIKHAVNYIDETLKGNITTGDTVAIRVENG
jgi:homoserine dehydrogenase